MRFILPAAPGLGQCFVPPVNTQDDSAEAQPKPLMGWHYQAGCTATFVIDAKTQGQGFFGRQNRMANPTGTNGAQRIMPAIVAERKLAMVPAIMARMPSAAKSCRLEGANAPIPPT